jgi:lauroyl/myristoyl acyltransferase
VRARIVCSAFSGHVTGAYRVTFRHLLGWKTAFYDGLIPACRALGPARGDAVLGAAGRVVAMGWPGRHAQLGRSLRRLRDTLGGDWDLDETRAALEANIPRFLARDCPLDGGSDAEFFGRFDVQGYQHLEAALSLGRGVILVGSHLGAHLSAAHWLYRRAVGLRMLIQRPQHVSALLNRQFDVADGPHPQQGFFVRRRLTPEEASKRIFRTRSAMRDGLVVYLKGDVPWTGPNTRPGRLLGYDRSFQSLWADFAALFRAPVVAVFCTHRPHGRYALTFDPPRTVVRGDEGPAFQHYLARLDSEIAAHPADAVAHLLWPCYGPDTDTPRSTPPLAVPHFPPSRAATAGVP